MSSAGLVISMANLSVGWRSATLMSCLRPVGLPAVSGLADAEAGSARCKQLAPHAAGGLARPKLQGCDWCLQKPHGAAGDRNLQCTREL